MKMSEPSDTEAASHIIRGYLADLYGCSDPTQIILCPGQLIGLIQVLHALRLRSILITDEEYYTPDHFPGMDVGVSRPENVANIAQRRRPDAVLMSLVTWKGRVLPVRREFQRLRALGGARPLLICDYAHAGAAGFPAFSRQQADIILGDLHKWVLPTGLVAQIGFLRSTTRQLQIAMNRIFCGYYLAGSLNAARAARWISPRDLMSAALWLQEANPTRRTLQTEHRRNLALARVIASDLGLKSPTKSCMLWLPDLATQTHAQKLHNLEDRTDVETWRTAEGLRILCFLSRKSPQARCGDSHRLRVPY